LYIVGNSIDQDNLFDMKKILLLLFIVGTFTASIAQNVGIGNTSFTPNASAILELRSTSSGFLLPKMTEAQKDAILNPTAGLIIYQTNGVKGFKYHNGTIWTEFGGAADNFGTHIAEANIQLDDFWLSNDGGNEGIRIDDNGNVGIGTSSPKALLNVEDGGGASLLISSSNVSAVGETLGEILFDRGNPVNDASAVIRALAADNMGSSNKGADILFMTKKAQDDNTDSATERMRITNQGNVGVGTSTPTAKLHTKGSVRLEGLSGSGDRMVVADNNGNLSTQSIPSGGGGFGSGTTLNLYLTDDVVNQNVSGVSIIRFKSDGDDYEIKGLVGGVAGQVICIVNTESDDKVKFKKNTGAQRFREDLEVNKKDGAIIMYDGFYWYIISKH
jgi:hypothetical protein